MDPTAERSRSAALAGCLLAGLLLPACARDPVAGPARDGRLAADAPAALIGRVDVGPLPPDLDASRPADEPPGWDATIGAACTRHGAANAHFDSLNINWRDRAAQPGTVDATVKVASGCAFYLVIGEQSPVVTCSVPGLKLPFGDGQKVRVTHCGDMAGPNEREYLVIRDLKGRLLLAGGGGSRMLDVPCVPPELKATRVDGACGIYDPTPDASFRCHGNRNFGVRLQADTSLTLWPREQGALVVHGQPYRAFALYSHDAIQPDGGLRCTDVMPYYVGYVVVAL